MQNPFTGRNAAALLLSLATALGSGQAMALSLSGQLGEVVPAAALLDEGTPASLQLIEATDISASLKTELVASEALAMIGTHYEFGSEGNDAVDCSSLVQQAYRAAGLEIPRTTREQVGVGAPVRLSELKKGDLVFYRWQRRNLHVAMYMDDGYILHASPGKGRVVMTRLNPSWQRRLVAARRLI